MYNNMIDSIKKEIDELTIKVEQLKNDEDACKKAYKSNCDCVCSKFVSTLHMILDEYEDSFAIKFERISPNYYTNGGSVEFGCEMGFIKDDSDRFDFRSTFYFYFRDGKIEVNSGTIGGYGLDDKYQLMRNKMIYYITCVHGKIIEQMLSSIDITDLNCAYDRYCVASRSLNSAIKELKSKENELIENSIDVGTIFIYDAEKSNQINRIDKVGSYSSYKSEKFVVTNITPKFITFDTYNMGNDQLVYRKEKIKKCELVESINSGVMLIVK